MVYEGSKQGPYRLWLGTISNAIALGIEVRPAESRQPEHIIPASNCSK